MKKKCFLHKYFFFCSFQFFKLLTYKHIRDTFVNLLGYN